MAVKKTKPLHSGVLEQALRLRLAGSSWQEILNTLDSSTVKNMSSEALRKKVFRFKRRDATSCGELDKLRSENLKLQDKVSFLSAQLKSSDRRAELFTGLENTLKELVKPFDPPPKSYKPSKHKKPRRKVDHVVLLSDEHADDVVISARVSHLEEFNFQVATRRMEVLSQRVIENARRIEGVEDSEALSGDLWVFCLGDHVNGTIHDAKSHNQWSSAMKGAWATSMLHACFMREMSSVFPYVHVVCVVGNHGRLSKKMDPRESYENWDHFVHLASKEQCRNLGNVGYEIASGYMANTEIQGSVFNLSHGMWTKSWNGIPHYGLERESRRLIALTSDHNSPVRYMCRGHFHQPSAMMHSTGEIFVNGSFKATDEYLLNAFTGYVEPTQTYLVVEDGKVTWRSNILLRLGSEKEVPVRYLIQFPGSEQYR